MPNIRQRNWQTSNVHFCNEAAIYIKLLILDKHIALILRRGFISQDYGTYKSFVEFITAYRFRSRFRFRNWPREACYKICHFCSLYKKVTHRRYFVAWAVLIEISYPFSINHCLFIVLDHQQGDGTNNVSADNDIHGHKCDRECSFRNAVRMKITIPNGRKSDDGPVTAKNVPENHARSFLPVHYKTYKRINASSSTSIMAGNLTRIPVHVIQGHQHCWRVRTDFALLPIQKVKEWPVKCVFQKIVNSARRP